MSTRSQVALDRLRENLLIFALKALAPDCRTHLRKDSGGG